MKLEVVVFFVGLGFLGLGAWYAPVWVLFLALGLGVFWIAGEMATHRKWVAKEELKERLLERAKDDDVRGVKELIKEFKDKKEKGEI